MEQEPADDAAIIRCFYTDCDAGLAAAEDWEAGSWGEAEWDAKVEKIITTYQKKAAKASKKAGSEVEAVSWRDMMYTAYRQERGVDPREVYRQTKTATKANPNAFKAFAALEQRADAQDGGTRTPPGGSTASRSVMEKIAERQREAREAEQAEAVEAQRRREELEMQRLQKELKVAERRRKLRDEEAEERKARERAIQLERDQALAQRAERAGDARQRQEEEAAMQQRLAAEGSPHRPAGAIAAGVASSVLSPRSEAQNIGAATKSSRALFVQKEAADREQAERDAELAERETGADSRVVEIIAARQREAAEAEAAEEEEARQARLEKERTRLEQELRWLEGKRVAAEADQRASDSDQPSAELQALREQLESEKAALAMVVAAGAGGQEERPQVSTTAAAAEDELAAVAADQKEQEAAAVAEATATRRARALSTERHVAEASAAAEEEREKRKDCLVSVEGARVAELVAERKRQAIAVLREAAEALARNAEAKAKAMAESELQRLEQRMQHQLDIVAQQFGVADDDSAAGAGIEELRELITTETAKLAAIEDLVAIQGKQAEKDAAGMSVEEVVSRAEAEGWDGGGLERLVPGAETGGDRASDGDAAGGDEIKGGGGVVDAVEQEQQNRREAIMVKQREALAALRAAEEQDQLQLATATEDEHRRSVEEWGDMGQQVLEAAKMGKEHALLIALMNELKEKYEAVQRRNAEQLLAINSLESQTYALQVSLIQTMTDSSSEIG